MAEGESRLAPLVHADQKYRHKPNAQGDFGSMKNRAGGDRSLMMTLGALIDRSGPFGPLNCPAFLPLTFRAQKPVGPPLLEEKIPTLFVGGKRISPLQNCHDNTPRHRGLCKL